MLDLERNRVKLISNTLDILYASADHYDDGHFKSFLITYLDEARNTAHAVIREANKQEKEVYPNLNSISGLTIELRIKTFRVMNFVRQYPDEFADMLQRAKIPIEYLFMGLDSDARVMLNVH